VTDITESHKHRILGYREHKTGFEGLIATADKAQMPAGVLVEPPSMDEIIIFLNKEAKKNGGK
jgi:ABC-2 type transport system ATP-binding protein